jgi:IclR family KDG regulon transcriptional repressor
LDPQEDDPLKAGAFMAVKGGKKQTDRHVAAVLASCEIMDSFLHCPNQTLKQIIDQTSLSRNRVMRLAGTLEARGYLHRDSRTGNYGLGTMLMSLGRVYESQSNVGSLGQPILQELARTTGESASIYVLDNLERVVLAREEGKKDVRLAIAVGQRMPIHVGAGGKVLLAFGPKEVRDKVLNGRRLSKAASGTITNPSKLADELDRIKTQGYAISIGERVLDAGAVAGPIFGLENRFLGALGVAGPIHRFTPETLPGKIKLVMSAAAELTWKLGGFPSAPSKGNQSLKCYVKTYAFNCAEASTE